MSGVPDDPADDATLWAGRLRPWPVAGEERADELTDERAEIDERTEPRSASRSASQPTTRREASGRIAAPADRSRSASVPTGAVRETYRPRGAEPVVVARATVPQVVGAGGPALDPEAVRRRERRGRTRLLVVVGLSALAALSAVAGIVVMLVIL